MITEYFFKKRVIFLYKESKESVKNKNIIILHRDEMLSVVSLGCKILRKLIYSRYQSDSWYLFAYIIDNKLVSYSFLHMPEKTEWHDSLPTLGDYSRSCNQFTILDYRGKSIITKLIQEQVHFSTEHNRICYSVVEQKNISSLSASTKIGDIIMTNYLIKLFGRNIFSVVTHPCKIYLLWGKKRARL